MYSSPFRHSTRSPKGTFACDLHVLTTPPAFVLSQDQTLHLIYLPIPLQGESRSTKKRASVDWVEAGVRSSVRDDQVFRLNRKAKLKILTGAYHMYRHFICHKDLERRPAKGDQSPGSFTRTQGSDGRLPAGHILVTTTLFTCQSVIASGGKAFSPDATSSSARSNTGNTRIGNSRHQTNFVKREKRDSQNFLHFPHPAARGCSRTGCMLSSVGAKTARHAATTSSLSLPARSQSSPHLHFTIIFFAGSLDVRYGVRPCRK